MVKQLNKILGDDGLCYGWEWEHDPFDQHVDRLLQKANREGAAPRVAVDIGCGTGYRAATLTALGLFDRVVACDISDRADIIALRRQDVFSAAANAATGRPNTQMDFLQISAMDLAPDYFSGEKVSFINFRNVAHFLAPRDLCRALGNIRDIAAEGALVAISFDYFREDGKYRGGTALSLADQGDAEAFYANKEWLEKTHAPYGRYRPAEIIAFMESLDLKIAADRVRANPCDFRMDEYRIAAYIDSASTPRAISAAGPRFS